MGKEQINLKRSYDIDLVTVILFLMSIIAVICSGYLFQISVPDCFKMIALMIILIFFLSFIMKTNQAVFFQTKKQLIILEICFFFSLVGVLLAGKYEIYQLWMLGAILIAALIHNYLGIAFHLLFTFWYYMIQINSIEYFILDILMGTILCILTKYTKKLNTLLYTIIIVISIHISLLLLVHNFLYRQSMIKETIFSVGSSVILIIISYAAIQFYNHKIVKQQNRQLQQNRLMEEQKPKKRTLEEIGEPNFELLVKFQEFSKSIYIHSVDIAEISFHAAAEIGKDAQLAKVGGLYHEVGRINGGNYIEEGIRLAKQYDFPEEVIEIIRQHNSKVESPKFPEAAIVMLTDSIVSALEYVEKTEKRQTVPIPDLVSNIFENRLSKGLLNEAGLSIEDYVALKNFYIFNCF